MKKGVDYEIDRVLNNKSLQNGSIVLFHNDGGYAQGAAGYHQGIEGKGVYVCAGIGADI